MRVTLLLAVLLLAGTTVAHEHAAPAAPGDPLAPLSKGAFFFENLGKLHRKVTTRSKEAQVYFDQGLRLLYGFNHDESTRSFAKAAELDPTCAMCFWGISITLGPNYNVPMLPERSLAAWAALQRAMALKKNATQVEQALIDALSVRYAGPEPKDPVAQGSYSEKYANAMRGVARRFPEDDDVQVLFAEALMDTNPWKLWGPDGKPAPGTTEIVSTLETVLRRNPNHPGANHYYIHAVEASPHPERAEPSADRLAALIPNAGHIVHMPSHIYQRIGRYADAAETNRRAIRVDEAYLARTRPPGYYPMYLGHNDGFLAYSASMLGRSHESLEAARGSVKAVPPQMLDMMPGMDFFASEPLLVMVRFGMWDAILKEPKPEEKYQILTALWLHARGMAQASTGKIADAEKTLEALNALQKKVPQDVQADQNAASALIAVAATAVEARVAEKQGLLEKAKTQWREAVRLEDGLSYSEPADWFYPLRPYLGAVLLDARKFGEAQTVFEEDLAKNPKNGWALYGRWQALEGQKSPEATSARKAFEASWSRADIQLRRPAY